ncbi:MAG: cyclic nucleotide-binding domain-containing protein [Myxococcales bacterium]|nr:cyclic nucleotide-binding domain-containing protein [Myxococcales bacterium]
MLADLALEGVRDRILMLRTNPNFAPLEDEDLLRIARHARVRRAKRGTVLTREGQPLERVVLVTEGRVVVRHEGRPIADIRGQGGVGLLSLFAGLTVTPHAEVLEDSVLLELPAEVVRTNVFDSFPIARNTLRLLALGLLERRGNLPAAQREPSLGVWRDREPTVVERVLRFRESPDFGGAHLDAIAEIARRATDVRFPEGASLWSMGDAPSFSLAIEYGRVRCTNQDGDSVVIGAGTALGILDALAGAPRVYDAVALTPVIATNLDTTTWLAVLEVFPELASTIRRSLSRLFLAG